MNCNEDAVYQREKGVPNETPPPRSCLIWSNFQSRWPAIAQAGPFFGANGSSLVMPLRRRAVRGTAWAECRRLASEMLQPIAFRDEQQELEIAKMHSHQTNQVGFWSSWLRIGLVLIFVIVFSETLRRATSPWPGGELAYIGQPEQVSAGAVVTTDSGQKGAQSLTAPFGECLRLCL